MTTHHISNSPGSEGIQRRAFLSELGLGFGGLALGAMLHRDGVVKAESETAWHPPDGKPHFAPKAKSVIWLFMLGGASHLEMFDPKPALNKYAGLTIGESPHADVLESEFIEKNVRIAAGDSRLEHQLFPLQVGYRKRGQSGIEVGDWLEHLGDCVDDMAVVRSMWTNDNNHGGQLLLHTGRHILDGVYPSIGAWAHYGLGALNENLPQFVVLGRPSDSCCGGANTFGASYLGPQNAGVRLNVDPENPLPFGAPSREVYREEQARQFELLGSLNRLAAVEYPEDAALQARIRSYELAFRMQSSVPEVMQFDQETRETHKLYGFDQSRSKPFGELCLAARRLVERGTRFVQVFHGGAIGGGHWDSHGKLKAWHSKQCAQIDKPIAGLLKDLKQRGLLNETLVVWASEFGRSPGSQAKLGGTGREHHPFGFTVWMAGGGIKKGITHGATDELGFHAVEHRHFVTDIHATVLHQLGLDPRKLVVPGRQRLDINFGRPIHDIIA